MIIIKYLQMNQILALNNPQVVDLLSDKPNQTVNAQQQGLIISYCIYSKELRLTENFSGLVVF